MKLEELQQLVRAAWEDHYSHPRVVDIQRQIMSEKSLSPYDKGYLLACFINHPSAKANSVAEQVALLGGLIENKRIVTEAQLPKLLAEIATLLM